MPDRPGWPATAAGEKLRLTVAARLRARRRMALLAFSALVAVPLAASACWRPPVLLLWNASASVPPGLYAVRHDRPVRSGDLVAAAIPGTVRQLAASRRYLPAGVPVVKRVAAGPGDRVCARGPEIRINGRPAALRRRRDPAGRTMPWWTGCRGLGPGQIFLLADNALSFDGRYFGTSSKKDVAGRAQLLWAR